MTSWEPICGVEPRTVAWRRGVRQWWPVTDRPYEYGPEVIGGQCPPHAPVTRTPQGYTCVETPWYRERERRYDEALRSGMHPVRAAAIMSLGQEPEQAVTGMTTGQLATTMVLRGAVGTLIGAAAAPTGREGIWGAAGFVMGATFGELGIVGVALAALWRKAG